MKKIVLDLDALGVESFATEPASGAALRGTVQGAEITSSGTGCVEDPFTDTWDTLIQSQAGNYSCWTTCDPPPTQAYTCASGCTANS